MRSRMASPGGGIADEAMPAVHRNLAGDERAAAPVAAFDDLRQIAALLRPERLQPPASKISSFTPPSARISRA
jgi:hypothetical protein